MSEKATCAKGHNTIRMASLPCPHPDCWKGGSILTVAKPLPPHVKYAAGAVGDEAFMQGEEHWKLSRVLLTEGTVLWGWRP